MDHIEKIITEIAIRHFKVETLEARKTGKHDFYIDFREVHVSDLREALLEAFKAGVASVTTEALHPLPVNKSKMEAAVELLADIGASYEYPGFISVGFLAFGDMDGDAYRFNRDDGSQIATDSIPDNKWELPLTASAEELAAWVREIAGKVGI